MNYDLKITKCELFVMKVLWQNSPKTANEIVEELSCMNWKPKTIRAFITRLKKKKALKVRKSGRYYEYFPTIDGIEYIKNEIIEILGYLDSQSRRKILEVIRKEVS